MHRLLWFWVLESWIPIALRRNAMHLAKQRLSTCFMAYQQQMTINMCVMKNMYI